jgi:sugar lactone lactonase YvrE
MFWPALLLIPLCLARPSRPQGRETLPAIRQLAQFPNQTWLENIAVRSNGQLLITTFSSPELYQIDPFQPQSTPQLVASFPDVLGILGITELEEDVFAITKGNFSSAKGTVDPSSFSVFKADLRKTPPVFSPIANVNGATILNGITAVKKGSRYLLTADSMAGVIWRVDMETGMSDVVLNNTATQPAAPFPAGFGANGVHTRDGVLYFTNSDRGLFRVPICEDGTPAGDVEALASFTGADDFALGRQGSVYIARGRDDSIEVFSPAGNLVALDIANENAPVLLEGNTAVVFGRTERDRNTLYVTTNGGWSGLVPGTVQVGGRVLAIDLEGGC